MNTRLTHCRCDLCGSTYDVFYDKKNDEYICFECIQKQEEEEDDYPLDMNHNEFKKEINK